jgi:Homeodomain-like domain
MLKPANVLPMTAEQKRTLEAWIRARTVSQKIVLRSRICLLAGEGKSNNAIADQLGTSRPTVLLWRERFKKAGPSGLSEDAPHGLSVQRLSAEKVNASKRIRRGVFKSVPELIAAIDEYILVNNKNPKPFVW